MFPTSGSLILASRETSSRRFMSSSYLGEVMSIGHYMNIRIPSSVHFFYLVTFVVAVTFWQIWLSYVR
ncbi:hypothetical protein CPC08DRAFT_245589 [Agrocybe pediades]|nr:hypothetical protein CPC08DRAFT_245589 [Agrocybe pediades]